MEREQLNRLLAEYATGGLTEEEKRQLFTAAMADQELFDQLMEEDSLREAIELPGARDRLIDSLQEDLVPAMAPAAAAPGRPRARPLWLAWAAGIGVVFVSGAITYVMMDSVIVKDIARVVTGPRSGAKPFVPPPAAKPAAAPKVVVEEPPKILAGNRVPMPVPPVVNFPLPSAPPPKEAEQVKEAKVSAITVAAESARLEPEPRAIAQGNAVLPAPSQQQAPGAPALARRQVGSADTGAAGGFARDEMARKVSSSVSVWRGTGDGVWTRVPPGEPVSRAEVLSIRYVPLTGGPVDLVDSAGRRLVRNPGRAGEELEFVLPVSLRQRTDGDSLNLTVVEGARSTPVKILLR